MTRKHFQAIADVLRIEKAGRELCEAMASELCRFNSGFQKQRFLRGCGLDA